MLDISAPAARRRPPARRPPPAERVAAAFAQRELRTPGPWPLTGALRTAHCAAWHTAAETTKTYEGSPEAQATAPPARFSAVQPASLSASAALAERPPM